MVLGELTAAVVQAEVNDLYFRGGLLLIVVRCTPCDVTAISPRFFMPFNFFCLYICSDEDDDCLPFVYAEPYDDTQAK